MSSLHRSYKLPGPGIGRRVRVFLSCVATIVGGSMLAHADPYLVDFEGTGETKTAYASGTVTLNGLQWDLTQALIGTSETDFKNGARSARLRGYTNSSMTMIEDHPGGTDAVSFSYRAYGTDAQVEWTVEYSNDGGGMWTSVGNFTATETPQVFNRPLGFASAVRIRIRSLAEADENRRLNIDDILLGEASGPDETPPDIASLSPADDSTDAMASDTLVITFDEPVVAGAGNITVMSGASTVATVPVDQVAVDGAEVTITLPSNLLPSTPYHVQMAAGTFEDLAGNAFAGITGATTWNFTTTAPDTTPPVIVTLTPAVAAAGVLPGANLVIELDETVVAGSGLITIFKSDGNVEVETFDIGSSPRIQIVDDSVFIDPVSLLEPSTSYYVTYPQGFVEDLAGNGIAALSGATAWNFTTGTVPALVINQYYEGAGQDRYIELKNTTSEALPLEGYRLAVWGGSNSENWKAAGGVPDRLVFLSDLQDELPPNSTYLIANQNAVAPAYAASSANAKNPTSDPATFYSGSHSIVLYDGGFTEDPENVVDAVSIVGSEGIDTSFYRLTEVPAFNFQPGSSIIDDLGQAWAQADLETVANANPADPEYLLAFMQTVAPVLDTFVVAGDVPVVVTPTATLDFTSSGGTATEFMVSDSPAFDGAVWTALPGSAPLLDTALPPGTKTIYFKLRNGFGESNVLSDEFESATYANPNTVIITQYYEGTSNNKYIELTNISGSAVDLGGWTIARWTNAARENWKVAGLPPSGTALLSGVLEVGQTVVLANNQAASPIDAGAAFFSSAVLNHNGDDSIALYEGPVTPANLRGVAGFAGNDGQDRSFVRIAEGQGFDFEPGTGLIDYPGIWQELALDAVNQALPGQNAHLGSYGDTVPPGGTYADWIAGFEVGTETGAGDDFDNDGIPNAIENYFGTDPSVASEGITEVGGGPGLLNFQHPISATPASDLFGSYEWSVDLLTWFEAGETSVGTTVDISVFENAGTATVVAEASGTPAPKIFVRLKVD